MKLKFATVAFALSISACASTFGYTGPTGKPGGADLNSTVVSMSREKVWDAAIPLLGKQFFVINNLDRSSGFINLSYSGDPTDYIDCGRVKVSTPARPDVEFPGASPSIDYVATAPDTGPYQVNRTVSLEGRMNLVLEEVDTTTTRVTVTTRYVVTRNMSAGLYSNSVTGSFDTGGSGLVGGGETAMTCQPTGRLEKKVTDIFNSIH